MMRTSRLVALLATICLFVAVAGYHGHRSAQAQIPYTYCYKQYPCPASAPGKHANGDCTCDFTAGQKIYNCIPMNGYTCMYTYSASNLCLGTCLVNEVLVECGAVYPYCN